MTQNQIAYARAKEEERANKTKERETERSNRASEKLTRRGQNTKLVGDGLKAAGGVLKTLSSLNDVSWYNENPALTKDVASISFNTPLGNLVNRPFQTKTNKKRAIPGVMAIHFTPTIGGTGFGGQISDVAAKNIYAFVRHANSGSRNYDSPDLLIYLYAMAEAYAFHASLRRIYSFALQMNTSNRYYYQTMLRACGVDPDDIRNNIANLRGFINSYAVRLNSFFVPKNMPMFLRRYWMNLHHFKDSKIRKSQVYLYVQDSFGRYNWETGKIKFCSRGFQIPEGGTEKLDYDTYSFDRTDLKTFSRLSMIGNDLISRLLDSEDIGIMSGDILKAYGENGVLFVPMISENDIIEAAYEPEVLHQINNTTLCGNIISDMSIYQTASGELTQGSLVTTTLVDPDVDSDYRLILTTNGIWPLGEFVADKVNKPTMDWDLAESNEGYNPILLNYYEDDPTPEQNLVTTRLVAGIFMNEMYRTMDHSINSGQRWGFPIRVYGTEIATHAIVYVLEFDEDEQTVLAKSALATTLFDGNQGGQGNKDMLDIFTLFMSFDWAPAVHCIEIVNNGTSSAPQYKNAGLIFSSQEYANVASLSAKTLANMHYVAVSSELGLSSLGLTTRTRK